MSIEKLSPLSDILIASGGVATEYQGRPVIRHFGDPGAEYKAATEEAVVFD